jgi:hypothetical protein
MNRLRGSSRSVGLPMRRAGSPQASLTAFSRASDDGRGDLQTILLQAPECVRSA